MQSIWLIAVAGLYLIIGIGMLFFAYRNARCAWFIKKAPISAISDLTTGYAAVHGRVNSIIRQSSGRRERKSYRVRKLKTAEYFANLEKPGKELFKTRSC